jgi:hypothetical protein
MSITPNGDHICKAKYLRNQLPCASYQQLRLHVRDGMVSLCAVGNESVTMTEFPRVRPDFFRESRTSEYKRCASRVRTATGFIFTGGAVASGSWIRASFCLRMLFSVATRIFLHELGLDSATACRNGEEIAGWLLRFSRSGGWEEQSSRSRRAFDLLQDQEPPAEKLKRALDRIA